MPGKVVTFYSYKGGVGRSFTLANVALLLARWGYRVLTIDWDLEAPGLHNYFADYRPAMLEKGVVDLADDFLAGFETPRVHEIRLDRKVGEVALLGAGRQDESYTGRVQNIDWENLYDQGFAAFLERCREQWVANYDFVLIDSRTGISDIASICTAHLPDQLVVVFTANMQSVGGVVDIARRADIARDLMPYDRQPHLVLPVLSRFDNRVEYEQAEKWREKCVATVAPLYWNWLDKGVSEDQMLRHATLPYVSYWSFGERLPVLEESAPSGGQISFSLETVAAVIAQEFDRTDLLADNRDAYVASARTRRRAYNLDVLVSSPRSARGTANELIEELRALNLRVDGSLAVDVNDQRKQEARHLCLVVQDEVTRWQLTEADRFLRNTLDGKGDRRLFCVLTRNTDPERLPAFLRNLRYLTFGAGVKPRQVARQLHDLIIDAPAKHADSDLSALRDAASALGRVPTEVARRGRWALIDETVHDMTAALDGGDLALLQDLTVDLELLNEVRAAGDLFAEPAGLRAQINALRDRVNRRITAFTK